jgi:mRNA interferase RelE/StbE
MPYTVSIRKRAMKALEGINEPYYSSIKTAIFDLEKNPRPQGYKKLKGRDGYRIRVGNYRVIYDIFDAILFIDVVELGHRKNIYE